MFSCRGQLLHVSRHASLLRQMPFKFRKASDPAWAADAIDTSARCDQVQLNTRIGTSTGTGRVDGGPKARAPHRPRTRA